MRPLVLILKGLLVVVGILVVLLFGYAIHIFYRPDLLVTELNRHIRSESGGQRWGTAIPLVPEVFAAGTSRAHVSRALWWSGYEWDDDPWAGLKPSFEAGEIAQREARRFPCNIRYYVATKFDASDRLERAEALVHEEGCL